MASGGGSGGSGGGSSGGKGGVIAVILGLLGITGLIIILGGGGGNDTPAPSTTVPSQVASSGGGSTAPTIPTAAPTPQSAAGFDREALRADYPGSVVITITGFSLPARVGIEVANPDDRLTNGSFDPGKGVDFACLPDDQYPYPCISYAVVKQGAAVTITAGDSRAGFWPVLDRLEGGSCTMPGDGGRDVTCSFNANADTDVLAFYYGQTTASGKFYYPDCPVAADRGNNPPAWASRCR